jgi:hypothetical protein
MHNKKMSYESKGGAKREFKLLSAEGNVTGTYTGSCPYQAAMKAASKGHESILLREHFGGGSYAPKLHMYQGTLRHLAYSEMTDFAKRHNIQYKPEVRKIGMMNTNPEPALTENTVPDYAEPYAYRAPVRAKAAPKKGSNRRTMGSGRQYLSATSNGDEVTPEVAASEDTCWSLRPNECRAPCSIDSLSGRCHYKE